MCKCVSIILSTLQESFDFCSTDLNQFSMKIPNQSESEWVKYSLINKKLAISISVKYGQNSGLLWMTFVFFLIVFISKKRFFYTYSDIGIIPFRRKTDGWTFFEDQQGSVDDVHSTIERSDDFEAELPCETVGSTDSHENNEFVWSKLISLKHAVTNMLRAVPQPYVTETFHTRRFFRLINEQEWSYKSGNEWY